MTATTFPRSLFLQETYPARKLSEILRSQKVEIPETKHRIVIGDSRFMKEKDIHLIATSPPYPMLPLWDEFFSKTGCPSFGDMHNYLSEVWRKCYESLCNGGILCVNIGDAYRRVRGAFKLYLNHVEVIRKCEAIGFQTMPFILWKKPTNRPNAFLGSGFLPTNAYVTQDCEYILLFRKGDQRRFKKHDTMRYLSQFSKDERDIWFSQIWDIKGTKQTQTGIGRRTGAFPEEVPYRLIRMFSIIGDTVLDPFLGTGTTMKVAKELYRNCIGYEIFEELLEVIKDEVGYKKDPDCFEIVTEGA